MASHRVAAATTRQVIWIRTHSLHRPHFHHHSTRHHPIQSFQWGDYTAKPKTTYQYKVIPAYGKPKLLELDAASATTVEMNQNNGITHRHAPAHDAAEGQSPEVVAIV